MISTAEVGGRETTTTQTTRVVQTVPSPLEPDVEWVPGQRKGSKENEIGTALSQKHSIPQRSNGKYTYTTQRNEQQRIQDDHEGHYEKEATSRCGWFFCKPPAEQQMVFNSNGRTLPTGLTYLASSLTKLAPFYPRIADAMNTSPGVSFFNGGESVPFETCSLLSLRMSLSPLDFHLM